MSIKDCNSIADPATLAAAAVGVGEAVGETVGTGIGPTKKSPGHAGGRPLQRLAKARKQQGLSLRTMARRLHVDLSTVIRQEQETADPLLSTIYAWQKILDVPVVDLLEDDDPRLSGPVFERARLVKLMKTAAAILERTHRSPMRDTVTELIEQLVEMMPELRDVGAWHMVGHRRTMANYGRIVERQVPDDFARRTTR
jgi:transcriptional regulator with XRE-family HTH domain